MRIIFTPRLSRAVCVFTSVNRFRVRPWTAFGVALAALSLSAAPAFAAPTSRPTAGEVVFAGGATVDGSPVISGQTFFSGSTISTTRHPRATLGLSNLARLELSAETTVKLDFSVSSVGGSLHSGRVRVFVPPGVASDFKTGDASVMTHADTSAVFSLMFEEGRTTVFVEAGRAEVLAAGVSRPVAAGEFFSTSDEALPRQADRHELSGGRRAGVLVVIAAVIAVLVVTITGRDDDVMLPDEGCQRLIFSPGDFNPPCN
ncbi:MAG TPA: hypothetical protein VEY09_09485 [Pyrinomonadaceae bacterium]|nr:hypothetical protein [Pyrinomonadaceae bacterium]